MASLRTRVSKGRTIYQVRWRQDGKEPSESFDKKADAIKFKGMVDAAGQRYPDGWVPGRGFVKAGGSLTLAEWFPRALAARGTASERTKWKYEQDFRVHVPEWLSSKPLAELSREDVGLWIQQLLGKKLSAKSIKNINGMLSSVVKDAILDGHLERNPFQSQARGLISRGAKPRPEMVILAPEEFAHLRECMTPHYRDFITFAYGTGLRFSEAIVLTPGQFDLEARRLRVDRAWKLEPGSRRTGHVGPPKTARGNRYIELSDAQCEMIEPRLGQELIFPNKWRGQIRYDSFRPEAWSIAIEKAELPRRPRFHDLRHSHASLLLAAGVPIIKVSRRLGHASIQTTVDVYGHLVPDDDGGIRNFLDRLG